MAKGTSENAQQVPSGAGASVPSDAKPVEEALFFLRKLATSLHSTLVFDEILDHVLTESLAFIRAENGLIALCCDGGITSVRYFRQGQAVATINDWSAGPEIPARVIALTQPYLSNDPQHDPKIDPARAAGNAVRSVMSSPLLGGDQEMIGYLELQNKINLSGFTSFDLELLTTVAQIAAQAISNAKAIQKIARDAVELEERVAERTAQLQEINDELDTFAFSVSHDLRAPLRAIQSFAGILLEEGGSAGGREFTDYAGRILSAAQDMDQMILDLLDYSRVSRKELLLHPVDLGRVVREAVEQLDLSIAGKGYHLELASDLPQVRGDHAELVQVVLNLLSNAVKYVAQGVTPELRIWAERANCTVRLFVQDNGIGIAPENQERIFKIFERLHGVETYQGNGIGLAIARKAVTRLGGRIGVQSSLGEGSRFWIELPSGNDRDD